MCCGVGSCHVRTLELEFTVECSRKWTACCNTASCGAVRAGLGDALFIFVQVALSTCIMQASEKILLVLHS